MQYYSGWVVKPDQTKLGSTKPNSHLDIGPKSFNGVIWTLGLSHYIGSFGLLDPSPFKLSQVMGRVRPLTNPVGLMTLTVDKKKITCLKSNISI